MAEQAFDVVVVGSGTAGTFAARTAAKLGARTALVSDAPAPRFGETCLERG